ncbi:MAG: STAS domain-containing protein [Acidobacteriota bacterium]|nr:STAS domain-containing protein [Acidobacteriota bacterium]
MNDSGISMETTAEGGARVLRVSGELSIANAAELRQALLGAMAGPGRAVLNLAALSSADLSGLQLLYSAHRSGRAADGRLEIAGVPQWLRTLAAEAGCGTLSGGDPREGCVNGEDDTHGR